MSSVVHVTQENYQAEVLDASVPVIIDFWAPWCGPCKAIGPILEALVEQYGDKVKVVKVNVDEAPALATPFGIASIPTLVVMKNGEKIDQQVGFRGRPALEAMFAKLAE